LKAEGYPQKLKVLDGFQGGLKTRLTVFMPVYVIMLSN